MTVEFAAVYLRCDLCDAAARFATVDNQFSACEGPAAAWLTSHLAPRLFAADVAVDGVLRTVPARPAPLEETHP